MSRVRDPDYTTVRRVDPQRAEGRAAGATADGRAAHGGTESGAGPAPRSTASTRPGSGSGDPRRRNAVDLRARTAWVAGGTGLVGRSVLPLLLSSQRYASVHAFVRSQASALPPSIKLHRHRVDFETLSALPAQAMAAADDVFILLGTTLREAGSETAFRKVDYDTVLAVARAARLAGATRVAVVSAMGADKTSRVFYNRVKGEMEHAIASLGFRTVVIAQPSLLVGDRRALGQPARPKEAWALRLLTPIAGLLPKAWRPIPARTVARAMVRAMLEGQPGVRVLNSAALRDLGY
jgi:uncharacterized protein YbjT (DUF2867 family)